MRTNTDILVNYEEEYSDNSDARFTWKTCESAMKQAQSEMLLRFVQNVESYPNYQAPYPLRFQLSSEKTKREIEEGKEYSWFEFMGRRHKGL